MRSTTRTLALATLAAALPGLGLGLALTGEPGGGRPPAVVVRGSAAQAVAPAPSSSLEPPPLVPGTLDPAPAQVDLAASEPAPGGGARPGEVPTIVDVAVDDESVAMTMADDDEDHDVRARAARLLAALAAEADPLAAEVIGEELAPLADRLDATGRATLLRLARDGDAPRAAALMALGRLEPTVEMVELVRDAVLGRPTSAARAAGVDALLLLGERGAPGDRVEAAVLALVDRSWER